MNTKNLLFMLGAAIAASLVGVALKGYLIANAPAV